MTSLLPAPRTSPARPARPERPAPRPRSTPGQVTVRVAPLAALGGVGAALATLVVCLAVGVLGWFLADAGAHGAPRDGLRVGALGWLTAHGSGLVVQGVRLGVVPLGLSIVCAWVVWRIGHRVGEAVSGTGPDAARIADGERDWTVPAAATTFALGYAGVAGVVAALAGTPATAPSGVRAVVWSLVLCGVLGSTAIAVGAGRAGVWAALLPATLRSIGTTVRTMLLAWAGVSALVFLAALVSDAGAAANVMSQVHADAGDAAVYSLLCTTLVPNAALFSSAYLLGPGFTVGAGTLVSTGSPVVLGPLPMVPLLAALPDAGPVVSWLSWLSAVPFVVAAVVVARVQRRIPTVRWDEGAARGVASGVLTGLVVGLLTTLAGGAAGPGRLRDVGPPALDVTLHAVVAFGVGGLVAGVVVTAWQRRRARAELADS